MFDASKVLGRRVRLTDAQERLLTTVAETREVYAGTPGYYSGPRPYFTREFKVTRQAAVLTAERLIEVRPGHNGWRHGVALTRDGEAVYEAIRRERGGRS